MARMVAAIRGHGPPLVTGDEARHSLQIIEALNRSHALGGARVAVGGTDAP
jgi:predicted dehydrogenase